MTSDSCSNLVNIPPKDHFSHMGHVTNLPPRLMPIPKIIPDFSDEKRYDFSSPVAQDRRIIVANQLPLRVWRDCDRKKWCFDWDKDALVLQLKDGLLPSTEVIYVGCLKAEIDPFEQEEISQFLFRQFKCAPTFLPAEIQKNFYHGFCKQHLWPLFHYMLPLSPHHGATFDRTMWQAYVSANKIFADKIKEFINPDDDYIWIHDYHLMVLPSFLRKRFNRVKLGFFLHSPFPSSEVYRTLPVREDILRALLNSDLIGFHTFDYARHFLSCCSRMFGLDYKSRRGYIGIEYYGRTVSIKILPVGIHMGQIENLLSLPETISKVRELEEQFKGKTVMVGVDDTDMFKGIGLKLLAMEKLLEQRKELRRKVVLVQITNPARTYSKDVKEVQEEAHQISERVNRKFGSLDYQPIILIDRFVSVQEKAAFYSVSECCVINPVRDGMNLAPYKYTVCRQLYPTLVGSPRKSMIIVSEFIGCSPSLSGAIRVNPWNLDSVSEAMNLAISLPDSEKKLRHEKHYKYVKSHDVGYWARSFDQDLLRACRDHQKQMCWEIGFGLGFRVVALGPDFTKLSMEHILYAYKRTNSRLILLDYDGTMMPQSSINKTPSKEVICILNDLCSDPKNVVFIVSGRGKNSLSNWFAPCDKLGISAEHGYFTRWSGNSSWQSCLLLQNFDWKKITEPVMRHYTEMTDGSYIEDKESALVWHHQEADPDFGSCQAKELINHLENVLANEPVVVKRGQHIVEVKPQGISKGKAVEELISSLLNKGNALDFILCIGDDRSDEDMFESIGRSTSNLEISTVADVFACTVGQKPSMAKYYLDDTVEVMKLLQGLSRDSIQIPNSSCPVSFEESVYE